MLVILQLTYISKISKDLKFVFSCMVLFSIKALRYNSYCISCTSALIIHRNSQVHINDECVYITFDVRYTNVV